MKILWEGVRFIQWMKWSFLATGSFVWPQANGNENAVWRIFRTASIASRRGVRFGRGGGSQRTQYSSIQRSALQRLR